MNEAGAATATQTSGVRDFTSSELFERTFQEGMELVEETAAYLDGAGRQDSKLLSRGAALAYAGESMRLTTRLMQVASWLLVQRAVREGDMSAAEAFNDRYRLIEPRAEPPSDAEDERVLHLDRRMYLQSADDVEHPVLAQHERLAAAFGHRI
jgi:regulator of CtrA degradation